MRCVLCCSPRWWLFHIISCLTWINSLLVSRNRGGNPHYMWYHSVTASSQNQSQGSDFNLFPDSVIKKIKLKIRQHFEHFGIMLYFTEWGEICGPERKLLLEIWKIVKSVFLIPLIQIWRTAVYRIVQARGTNNSLRGSPPMKYSPHGSGPR